MANDKSKQSEQEASGEAQRKMSSGDGINAKNGPQPATDPGTDAARTLVEDPTIKERTKSAMGGSDRVRYQLSDKQGWFDGKQRHKPGSIVEMPPEIAHRLGATELDAEGRPTHRDKIANRETGEARGLTRR